MINKDSDFDDLIEEYIQRFTTLAGNSNVLVESFYQKVDKNITKRFAFESKLLQKIDKYRFKVVKKAIRSDYGWWARLKRRLHGKPNGAGNSASCPPANQEKKEPEPQALLNQITTLTQQINTIEQKRTAQALPLNVVDSTINQLEPSLVETQYNDYTEDKYQP